MHQSVHDILIDAFHRPEEYDRLLARDTPVVANPFQEGVICFRHADLAVLSGDPVMQAANRRPSGDRGAAPTQLSQMFDHHPVFMNEPEHKTTRKAAFKILAADGTKAIQAYFDDAFDSRLGALAAKGQGDLIADVFAPVITALWSRIATGDDSHGAFLGRSVRPVGGMMGYHRDDSVVAAADGAAQALMGFFVEAALTDPALTAALSFDAIDGMGGMTTNAAWLACYHPGTLQSIDGDAAQAAQVWTEATRLAPAIQGLFRSPSQDITVGAQTITEGTTVLMLYAAANRDAIAFDDPHSFRPGRESAPMTFGLGPRACIGRGLSKIAGCSASLAPARHFPEARLLHQVSWGTPGLGHTPTSLMVAA